MAAWRKVPHNGEASFAKFISSCFTGKTAGAKFRNVFNDFIDIAVSCDSIFHISNYSHSYIEYMLIR